MSQPHHCEYVPKRIKVQSACRPMSFTALFTITKFWNQLRCPSAAEWTNKTWYIHVIEFY
jgi:hypothetical protein